MKQIFSKVKQISSKRNKYLVNYQKYKSSTDPLLVPVATTYICFRALNCDNRKFYRLFFIMPVESPVNFLVELFEPDTKRLTKQIGNLKLVLVSNVIDFREKGKETINFC